MFIGVPNQQTDPGFMPCPVTEARERWREARQAPPAATAEDSATAPGGPAERETLLAETQREAEEILRTAHRQVEKSIAEAREEALREAQAQLQAAVSHLAGQFETALLQRLEQIETEMPRLLVEMAEKIIGREIQQDDQVVLGVVRQALRQVAGARQVQILINPADEPAVRAAQEQLLAHLGEATLQISTVDNVERGGAILRTERGEVDARIRVQLEILSEMLDQAAREG